MAEGDDPSRGQEAAVPRFGIVIDVAIVVNSLLVCTSYLIVATECSVAIRKRHLCRIGD